LLPNTLFSASKGLTYLAFHHLISEIHMTVHKNFLDNYIKLFLALSCEVMHYITTNVHRLNLQCNSYAGVNMFYRNKYGTGRQYYTKLACHRKTNIKSCQQKCVVISESSSYTKIESNMVISIYRKHPVAIKYLHGAYTSLRS
jgi:hypothetical protein